MNKNIQTGFWRTNLHTDKKVYALVSQNGTQISNADAYCRNIGATVAALISKDKFDFFTTAFGNVSATYMGMRDDHSPGIRGYFTDQRGASNQRQAQNVVEYIQIVLLFVRILI